MASYTVTMLFHYCINIIVTTAALPTRICNTYFPNSLFFTKNCIFESTHVLWDLHRAVSAVMLVERTGMS